MSRYLLRQISLLLVTLLLLSVLAFALNYWFPGNALTNATGIQPEQDVLYAAAYEARHFDKNIFMQYLAYLSHLLNGDWGTSLLDSEPVWNEIELRLGATMEIVILAMGLMLLAGIPLGVVAALNARSNIDHSILVFSLSGYSIPMFWFAQILILVFSVQGGWLPISGQINPLYDIEPVTGSILLDILLSDYHAKRFAALNAFQHMLLPVLSLAMMPTMLMIRITRNAMIEVLQSNYITGAYSKGMATSEVLTFHAFPNTMQTVVRQLGSLFSLIVTNTLVIEVIFSWPGIGSWLVRSIYERDYPVIQAGLLVLGALLLLVNVLLNLFHAWRYPQIRQELYERS